MKISDFEIGGTIRFGKKYCEENHMNDYPNEREIVQGYFEYYNGLYDEIETCPSVILKKDEEDMYGEYTEYESMYHLFGNELDGFMDCEYVPPTEEKKNQIIEESKRLQKEESQRWADFAEWLDSKGEE